MKIRILDAAQQDLVNGFRFYEAQGEGFGGIFLIHFIRKLILSFSMPAFIAS